MKSKPDKIKFKPNTYLNKKEVIKGLKAEIKYYKDLMKDQPQAEIGLNKPFIEGLQTTLNNIKEWPCDEVFEVVSFKEEK